MKQMNLISIREEINNSGVPVVKSDSKLKLYETLFYKIRNESLNVLEIGVNKGGSALLWERYFVNSNIYGIDICLEKSFIENTARINLFECDQRDVDKLKTIIDIMGGSVDIVIDDGSHRCDDVILTMEFLLPYVNLMYINEDVCIGNEFDSEQNTSNWYKSSKPTFNIRDYFKEFKNNIHLFDGVTGAYDIKYDIQLITKHYCVDEIFTSN